MIILVSEQCRGTQDKKTTPQSVKENCRTPKEDKTSKRGESIDVARKSGVVIAKTKDVNKAKKRDIKSTPYSRPEKFVLPKSYKIPKVVVSFGVAQRFDSISRWRRV